MSAPQDPLSQAVTPDAPFLRKIIEQNRAAVAKDDEGLRMRAQHGRSHGCVAARFSVRPDLPERFRHGLFAQPGEFKALIRFSNGAQFADDVADAHGMAIKLLDVPGEKLLGRWREQLLGVPETPDGQLDFVLVDTDTYPSWEPEGYEALNRLITGALAARRALDGRRPRNWEVMAEGMRSLFRIIATRQGGEFMKRAGAFAAQVIHSPLATDYWSTQPYALGPDQVVRYVVRTPLPRPAGKLDPLTDPDGLGKALRKGVASGETRFEFCLIEPPEWLPEAKTLNGLIPWATDARQRGTADGVPGPAGDPRHATVAPVADLVIPKGADFDVYDGQSLEFSPWRTLAAHEPLGPINRIRLFTYLHLAQERFPAK